MKARIPKRAPTLYTEHELEQAVIRSQWLMLLAFNESLGIGEQRIYEVFESYAKLLNEYLEHRKDDINSEMLARAVRRIMPKSFGCLTDAEIKTKIGG